MKKVCVILLGLYQMCCFISAQNDVNSLCSFYFYRIPDFAGSSIRIKILLNDTPIIRLKNGSVYKQDVYPGEYTIECNMYTSSKLRFYAEPGKSYYIKCYFNSGFWSAIPVLELVDSISALATINGGKLQNQYYEPILPGPPKNRLGINLGVGVGFEDILMGYDDKNNELNLSTGGGFMFGAEFGTQVYKYFDLTVNAFYQSSAMKPPVDNADASFYRACFSLTPALIIPVKGGDFMRFRVGIGPDMYLNSTMDLNFSDAGGEDIILKYLNAIGFHGSIIFSTNFSEHFSFCGGVKYYSVNYKYTETGSTGFSTDDKAMNPDGSGFDYFIGYLFHF